MIGPNIKKKKNWMGILTKMRGEKEFLPWATIKTRRKHWGGIGEK